MTLATNKDDLTVSATDHPEHHNALATVANRLDGRVIDVTDAAYGADPTGVANSTTAIQAAIDAAASGDTVYVPQGTYLLNTGLTIDKQINLLGEGMGSTTFKVGAAINALSFNVGAGTGRSHLEIGRFAVGSSTDRASGAAVRIGRISQSWIHDIWVSNAFGGRIWRGLEVLSGANQCYYSGLRINDSADNGITIYQDGSIGRIVDHWFEDTVQVENSLGYGMLMQNGSTTLGEDLEGIYLFGGTYAGSGLEGVKVDGLASSTIKNIFLRGTILDGNDSAGFSAGAVSGGTIQVVRLEDVWCSHNTDHGLVMGVGVDDFVIDGGHSSLNDKSGILVYGGKNGTIQNTRQMSNARLNVGDWGIMLLNVATRIVIMNNRVYNNTDVYGGAYSNGILVDTGCVDNSVIYNDLVTGNTPFSDLGTNTTYYGNRLTAGGNFISGQDINAPGGYRQTLDGWYAENPTGTAGPTVLTRLATTTDNPNAWIAPRAGSITAVSVHSNAARATGTLTATVRKNATPIALTAVLDGTNTTFKTTTSAKDTLTFAAGDLLDVTWTTSSWTPTTADIRASIEVET